MLTNEGRCFSAVLHNSGKSWVYGGSSPKITRTPFKYFHRSVDRN
jgi:hypothetical protein